MELARDTATEDPGSLPILRLDLCEKDIEYLLFYGGLKRILTTFEDVPMGVDVVWDRKLLSEAEVVGLREGLSELLERRNEN